MKNEEMTTESDRVVASQSDARGVLVYLVVQESDQYIAIMDLLESSISDLTSHELFVRLQTSGAFSDEHVLEARLDKLKEWRAVSIRTDATRILRHSDLIARNWRYTATIAGRQVQRFYHKVLAGTHTVREIPLPSLARVVEAAEMLVVPHSATAPVADLIGRLFVNHDDLDAALVGAEDSLVGLVDRFDLNDQSTAELKSLLVGYATHVAAELERGSARAYQALALLRARFPELSSEAIRASDARLLIERGALTASHGGRVEDWDALLAWFNPASGRSARFALRLVRALPGMHINLRRLHSSSGTATSRSRALALAKACANPIYGTAVFLAALGDHPWRKLYGEAEDTDVTRIVPWREGPRVEVPELLRNTGRAGARGRAAAARDDTEAREFVRVSRLKRAAEHAGAIHEVLATGSGRKLSDNAARVALAALMSSVRALSSNGRRTAVRDGLGCTLVHTGIGTGLLRAPAWRVLTPGRFFMFHLPGVIVSATNCPPAEEHDQSRSLFVGGAE
jgi:hypothetical protein